MPVEIERKFLVCGSFPHDLNAKTLLQGYIAREAGRSVRVRASNGAYKLGIKGPPLAEATASIARQEFEVALEPETGDALLFSLCSARIEKVRHVIPQGDLCWEIDVFSGANLGLILAEIELPDAAFAFEKPHWLGRDVSHDERFLNANLASTPFSTWGVSYADLLNQD